MSDANWKPIPGFPDYEVSDQGGIRSLGRTVTGARGFPRVLQGKVIKLGTAGNGYLCGGLRRNGKTHTAFAHHAVAAAFIGERPEGAFVLHSDGNKLNNTVSNLRYGTCKDNYWDSREHGGAYLPKLTNEAAYEIKNSGRTTKELSEEFGVSRVMVSGIKYGKFWKNIPGENTRKHPRQDGKSAGMTDDDARYIRHSGERTKDLVAKYGVSSNTIQSIKYGRTFKHVE